MWKTTKRVVVPLLAALVAGPLAAGCSLGGGDDAADKAGGSNEPVVLRLAYAYGAREGQPDELMLRDFATRVAELSRGRLQIRLFFGVAGDETPDIEERLARMVRDGRFDLGWVATRVWDELGVKSFRALQAPFLITNYELLDRVVTGPLADDMLAGLRRARLVGLGIVPELLRHPVGRTGPLVAVEDFAGARIRTIPSRVTDSLVAALGGTPVHVGNAVSDAAIAHGRIDGEEGSIQRARGGWTVAANVVFFGKANTLFANHSAFLKLADDQQAVLRRAAKQTARDVAGAPPSERALARSFCSAGQLALASPRQLADLRRAARPVYRQLERDPLTRALIARIRRLKRSLAGERTAPAVSCPNAEPTAPAAATPRPAEAFDGTYRWVLTKEAAERLGSPNDPDIGNIVTMTLRDGHWLLGRSDPDRGSFTVRGNRLIFKWAASVLTFTFTRDPDGTLHLKPVPPMEAGDRFIWAGGPWRRIGPPVVRP